jgi:hypothetical protein
MEEKIETEKSKIESEYINRREKRALRFAEVIH